ncbi:hypothetical protein WDU94_007550 [Cyamophila willieti]
MLRPLRRLVGYLNLTVSDDMLLGKRFMGNVKIDLVSRVSVCEEVNGSPPKPKLQSHSIKIPASPKLPFLCLFGQGGVQPDGLWTTNIFALKSSFYLQPVPIRHYSCCIDDGTSNKPDSVTGMTPKMVKLLKCLSTAIKPEMHTHGVNILKRMFQMDPNIQRMFPKFACDDMCALDRNPAFQKHVDAIMKSLLNLMDSAGSLPDIKSSLAVLIKIHKDMCIPPKHFITFGNALNDYLKETLGVKYSEDVECAVAYFWKYVVQELTVTPLKAKCPKCGCTILKEC